LVRLVDGVGERQAHMPTFHVELGQDSVAKSFGRDAGAIGDEKTVRLGMLVIYFK
jgi:hypothetical protein